MKSTTVSRNDTARSCKIDKKAQLWSTKVNPEYLAEYEILLSAVERKKADAFRFEKDRNTFVTARGLLRQLVGHYQSIDPEKINFQYTEYGKPYLAESDLQFNVSHSENRILIGFNELSPIGVDIERIKYTDDLPDVAERFFSKNEVLNFMQTPDAEKPMAFFRCWTRKEAFIKAVGHGLSFPLDQFEVSMTEDAQLNATHFSKDERQNWSLWAFPVDYEFVGAVAIRNKNIELELLEIS